VVVGFGAAVVVGVGAVVVVGVGAAIVEGAAAASDVIRRVAPPSDWAASPAPSPTIATVTAVTLSIHFLAVVVMTAVSFEWVDGLILDVARHGRLTAR
jgi:hypothetical protein